MNHWRERKLFVYSAQLYNLTKMDTNKLPQIGGKVFPKQKYHQLDLSLKFCIKRCLIDNEYKTCPRVKLQNKF